MFHRYIAWICYNMQYCFFLGWVRLGYFKDGSGLLWLGEGYSFGFCINFGYKTPNLVGRVRIKRVENVLGYVICLVGRQFTNYIFKFGFLTNYNLLQCPLCISQQNKQWKLVDLGDTLQFNPNELHLEVKLLKCIWYYHYNI